MQAERASVVVALVAAFAAACASLAPSVVAHRRAEAERMREHSIEGLMRALAASPNAHSKCLCAEPREGRRLDEVRRETEAAQREIEHIQRELEYRQREIVRIHPHIDEAR
jgi:hypothetical protein